MNIIGSGMVARAFMSTNINISDVTIFAAGVSNSKETNPMEFERECKLLKSIINTENKLIYISSCIVNDSSLTHTPYSIHKRNIEKFINKNSKKYTIFRVPQLVGHTKNKNTILEYFYSKILSNEVITVWKNAYRSLLDIDDFVLIVIYILKNNLFDNMSINLAPSKSMKVLEILSIMESILQKKAKKVIVDKESQYECENENLDYIFKDLNLIFDESYSENIIKKYFSVSN